MGARNILRLFNDALAGEDQSVEQLTSTTTETTLNSVTGTIDTYPSVAAAGASASFTLKNDKIKAGSLVLVSVGNYLQGRAISAISTASDAEFTTTGLHGLSVGDDVTVIGTAGSATAEIANGRHTVTAVGSTTKFKVGLDTSSDTMTVTNSFVSVPAARRNTDPGLGTAVAKVTHTTAGQCDITIENEHASAALNGAVPVRFVVLD